MPINSSPQRNSNSNPSDPARLYPMGFMHLPPKLYRFIDNLDDNGNISINSVSIDNDVDLGTFMLKSSYGNKIGLNLESGVITCGNRTIVKMPTINPLLGDIPIAVFRNNVMGLEWINKTQIVKDGLPKSEGNGFLYKNKGVLGWVNIPEQLSGSESVDIKENKISIKLDEANCISFSDKGLKLSLADNSGLKIENTKLSINLNSSSCLSLLDNRLTVKLSSGLEVDQNGNLKAKLGDYLTFDSSGNITVTGISELCERLIDNALKR